mmetsp:Transcript_27005/g.46060  ORF Transcript_27005/g.46060 Transcript_27005/m.46060 type:complete len:122 (+) Transcript_27005:47-412(+)
MTELQRCYHAHDLSIANLRFVKLELYHNIACLTKLQHNECKTSILLERRLVFMMRVIINCLWKMQVAMNNWSNQHYEVLNVISSPRRNSQPSNHHSHLSTIPIYPSRMFPDVIPLAQLQKH